MIKVVDKIDAKLLGMAKGSTGSDVGTGGMATKLTAKKDRNAFRRGYGDRKWCRCMHFTSYH